MSDGHSTATQNNYTVTFHPAFASRCVVRGQDGEHEVYKQKEAHKLKNGEKHPRKHTVKLKGGRYNRDITLEVDDPNNAIARISVELYGEGHVAGAGAGDASVETFDIYNDPTTCPPNCDDPLDGGLR